MIELNRSLVDAYLDEAVAEFGEDYVYYVTPSESRCAGLSCKYVRNGAPACLVGQVLAKAGVPLDRLSLADTGYFGSGVPANELLVELRQEGVLACDSEVVSLLNEAQWRQDEGYTWGASVRAARNTQ
jgi:hypothetical protein